MTYTKAISSGTTLLRPASGSNLPLIRYSGPAGNVDLIVSQLNSTLTSSPTFRTRMLTIGQTDGGLGIDLRVLNGAETGLKDFNGGLLDPRGFTGAANWSGRIDNRAAYNDPSRAYDIELFLNLGRFSTTGVVDYAGMMMTLGHEIMHPFALGHAWGQSNPTSVQQMQRDDSYRTGWRMEIELGRGFIVGSDTKSGIGPGTRVVAEGSPLAKGRKKNRDSFQFRPRYRPGMSTGAVGRLCGSGRHGTDYADATGSRARTVSTGSRGVHSARPHPPTGAAP